jgi:hypothetical protein
VQKPWNRNKLGLFWKCADSEGKGLRPLISLKRGLMRLSAATGGLLVFTHSLDEFWGQDRTQ